MKAEILCVGTELLLGDIVNTNAAYIARGLAAIGVSVYHQSVVGDNPDRLRNALKNALEANDCVIMTGGLGPTYDDLTKETVAELFGLSMRMDATALERITAFFTRSGRPMTENNKKQALIPEGAIALENDNGTAPGIILEKEGKIVILMPGVPREMKPMFDHQVTPYLKGKTNTILHSATIHIFGMGESRVEDRLHNQMLNMTNPTIAPYAKDGEVQLRVTASAATIQIAKQQVDSVVAQICNELGEVVYGIDIEDMQHALVKTLLEKKKIVATAESCTGGLLSKRITEVPGSSSVFTCGVCSYANEIKESVLGVKHETLEKYGAVSAQTAAEMAAGIRRISGADIGISTTGIAGPGGGSAEKPVGLVYVGVDSDAFRTTLRLMLGRGYGDEREYIRYVAATHALNLARKAALAEDAPSV